MFGNRSFRVKVVKDEPTVENISPPTDFTKIADTVTKNVIAIMVAYVGVDTLRRLIVHAVTTKL